MTIAWTGLDGKPQGTVKYIADYGQPYTEDEKSGHFFPIAFKPEYYGKDILVGSQNGEGGKTIKPTAEDPYLIIRVENVTVDKKISAIVSETKEKVFELDFNKVMLPDIAVMGQEETIADYGNKPVSELMQDDVKIDWDGTTGYVTGQFYKVTGWEDLPSEPHDGYFFAMRVNKQYLGLSFTHSKGDDAGTTVLKATEDEMFWILNIEDKQKHTFKSGENIIAELDFTGVTLLPGEM